MAAAGDIQELCDEATCPICLEYFRDPVTITKCGHNFCQGCLTQFWGEDDDDDGALDVSCPHCRETTQRKSFVPSWALKNVVEIAKKLSLGAQRNDQGVQRVCEKHQEPLKLFCRDHQAPICVVCDRSKEHEGHKVVPQEEACQEYKDQICTRLKKLRAERGTILMYKADTEKQSQDLLKQTEEKRQKTKAEFRQMHQFLEEQEKSLLAQIEELEKEVARRRDQHLARLGRELYSLENIIQEMEKKCQQPASEFLQDVKKTLQSRSKKNGVYENPVAFPPELTCRIRELFDIKPILEGIREQFPANVTLDPDTAYPELILSEDHKSVRWRDKYQVLPNNPERFDCYAIVLGCEGFTAGRHFWEVTVGGEDEWAVGIARKSVRRKGKFDLSPKEGIWALGKWGGGYKVVNSPNCTPLSLNRELKVIRVTLNYDEGQVAFSDADTGVHIYTYSGASFCGETLLPFLHVYGEAHLRLSL